MATIEIQLKAYAKILGTERNCQVDLKRSVFEIDRDVNEIRIPLQAIVKLRKTLPQSPAVQAASSSILPAPQQAQMSLPIIPKLQSRDEEQQMLLQDPNLKTMVSTFNIPITVGKETKMVKTTLRYRKSPKAPVAEVETQTEENATKQMPLTELYPKDPVARALMFHQDRLQPVKQALREIKTKISNLRLEQKTTRRNPVAKGAELFYGTEVSNCPFYQFLLNKDNGPIDMDTPISKILGSDVLLAFGEDGGRPSIRRSTLKGDKRESRASGASSQSKTDASSAASGEAEKAEATEADGGSSAGNGKDVVKF